MVAGIGLLLTIVAFLTTLYSHGTDAFARCLFTVQAGAGTLNAAVIAFQVFYQLPFLKRHGLW